MRTQISRYKRVRLIDWPIKRSTRKQGKMKDNLRLSRLAYPRATLITVSSLSLLILSVGLFADTSTEPLAVAELLANNGLLKQLTSTFS
jgi:hypothetical protein